MNDHPAHTHDIVRVHDGVTIAGRNASGIHLTVIATDDPAPGVLHLSEWTGNDVYLRAADVDVITPRGVVA
jgi:H2-forming N5,N10-methylenetetrahydromethanopterin dehydrogenase-like enzyme